MAIAFARVSIHSRSKGHSAVAASSYRAGIKLTDERTGITYDYSKRKDVVFSQILLPENSHSSFQNREFLWNQAEAAEKRRDAQVCKDIVLALPRELSFDLQSELSMRFAQEHFVNKGIPADIAIHHHKGENPHAHILIPTRRLEREGFSCYKARDLNPTFGKRKIPENEQWGERWRDFQNVFFQEKKLDLVVDANHLIARRHQGKGAPYLAEENQLIKEACKEILITKPEHFINHLSQGLDVFTHDDIEKLMVKTLNISKFSEGEFLTQKGLYEEEFSNGHQEICHPILEKIMRGLQTDEGIFNEKILKNKVLEQTDSEELFNHIYHKIISHKELINLGLGENGRVHFVSREAFELEAKLINTTKQLATNHTFHVSKRLAKCVGKQFGLNASQQRALIHLTRSPNAAIVCGYAGTGKTYLLKAAKEVWEKSGFKMIGLSTSGKAASGLESETGIPSHTLHSFLYAVKNKRTVIDEKTILIMDEMGMTSLDDMSEVIAIAQKHGAKFTGVGDSEQTQPVGRGAPQRAMVETIGAVSLDEIIRQKIAWQRQATTFFETNQTALGFELYVKNECVKLHDTNNETRVNTVQQWYAEYKGQPQGELKDFTLAAFKNETVDELNCLARQTLVDNNELALGIKVSTTKGKIAIAVGERLLFTKNTETGIRNGDFATITALAPDGKTFEICLDNGKTMTINPITYRDFTYGYAATVHKLQGHTTEQCYVVIDGQGWDRHKFLVAATRHKKRLIIHAAKEDFSDLEALKKVISRHGLNDILMDFPVAFGGRRNFDTNIIAENAVNRLPKSKLKVFDALGYLFSYQAALQQEKEAYELTQQEIQARRNDAVVVAEFCDNRTEIAQKLEHLEILEDGKRQAIQEDIYRLQCRNGDIAERLNANLSNYLVALERNRVEAAMIDKAINFNKARLFVQALAHHHGDGVTISSAEAYQVISDLKTYYAHVSHYFNEPANRTTFLRDLNHLADKYRREIAIDRYGIEERALINTICRYKALDYEVSNRLITLEFASDPEKESLYQASIHRNRLASEILSTNNLELVNHFVLKSERLECHAASHQDRLFVQDFSRMVPSTKEKSNLAKQAAARKIKKSPKQFGMYITEFVKEGWKEINIENWHYERRQKIVRATPEFRASLKQVQAYKNAASEVYPYWQKALNRFKKGSPHTRRAFKHAEMCQWQRAIAAHELMKNVHAHTEALTFEKVDIAKLHQQARTVNYLQRYRQETRETLKARMAHHIHENIKNFKAGLAVWGLGEEVKEFAHHYSYLKRVKEAPTPYLKTLIRLSREYQNKKNEARVSWAQVKAFQYLKMGSKGLQIKAKQLRQQRNEAAHTLLKACENAEQLTRDLTGVHLNIVQLKREAHQYQAEQQIFRYLSAPPDEKSTLAKALLADKSHYHLLFEHKITFATLKKDSKPFSQKNLNLKEKEPLSTLFLDANRINEVLMGNPNNIYQAIIGEPKSRSNSYMRYSGGVIVSTKGPHAGKWYSFSEGKGGAPLSAIQHFLNLSFPQALAHGISLAGLSPSEFTSPSSPIKEIPQPIVNDAEQKIKQGIFSAQSIWNGAIEAKDTLAERYFIEHRKLENIDNLQIRYWPKGAPWIDFDDQGTPLEKKNKIPAAVIAAFNDKGEQVSIQRIYLDEKTAGKNTFLKVAKLTKGSNKGAGGLIQQGKKGGLLYIAEGPETAASLANLNKDATVLVSFSVSNIASLTEVIKAQRPHQVIIAADNDGENAITHKTTEKACQSLRTAGIDARIVMPDALSNRTKTDWNDVLIEKGSAGLAKHFYEKIAKSQFIYEKGVSLAGTVAEAYFNTQINNPDLTDVRLIDLHLKNKDVVSIMVPLRNSKNLLCGEEIIILSPNGKEVLHKREKSSPSECFYMAQKGNEKTLIIVETVIDAKKSSLRHPNATIVLSSIENNEKLSIWLAEQGIHPAKVMIKTEKKDLTEQLRIALACQNFHKNKATLFLMDEKDKLTKLNPDKLEKSHLKKTASKLMQQIPRPLEAIGKEPLDSIRKKYPKLREYEEKLKEGKHLSGYFKERTEKQLMALYKEISQDKKLIELLQRNYPKIIKSLKNTHGKFLGLEID